MHVEISSFYIYANGLRKPAVWLTCLFRALHTDLQSCWSQLLASAHVPWHTDPAWYANKSTDVVDTVFTVRYIDDLTSGPNPWLSRLLHTSQFVMGHTITGIYPRNLTLQFTGADSANPDLFHTLDITITTTSSRQCTGWL
jgi:hypothetical protein